MTAPCPTCGETGGFHDRKRHAEYEVPAHLLLSGDRRDAYTLAQVEELIPGFRDNLAAAAEEMLMWGNVYYDAAGKVVRSQNVPVPIRGLLGSTGGAS